MCESSFDETASLVGRDRKRRRIEKAVPYWHALLEATAPGVVRAEIRQEKHPTRSSREEARSFTEKEI
jgi:hypothetical protein